VKEGFARLAGELGDDQIIRGAKKRREFRGGKGVVGFEGDPLGTREVRGGDDARTLREFREIFRRHFEGEPDAGGFQRRDGKHFAGDFEQESVIPLDLLGDRRKREAEFAELIDVHR